MSESEKIETKSVLGQAHPATCWGWWDEKAKECSLCLVAERCAETTRRVSSKGSPVVLAKQAPAAPATTTAPVPAIVKPKTLPTEQKPVETKAEAKPEPKVEPKAPAPVVVKEEPKAEAPVAPKVEAVPEVKAEQKKENSVVAAVLARIPNGTFKMKEGEMSFVHWFYDASGKGVLAVAVSKEDASMQMQSPKGRKNLDAGADMTEALDALL